MNLLQAKEQATCLIYTITSYKFNLYNKFKLENSYRIVIATFLSNVSIYIERFNIPIRHLSVNNQFKFIEAASVVFVFLPSGRLCTVNDNDQNNVSSLLLPYGNIVPLLNRA